MERGEDGKTNELHFASRLGMLRRGDDYWFDGSQGWQLDARRNIRVPASLRQHEKAAWPMWVRGHWWLNPDSGFAARVLAPDSNGREIAVALAMPGGVVGATVYINRTTWLPSRVVVPYERGPFTERYENYRAWRRGKSFALGCLRIESPVFRALDLSENNAPPGERRMGTIGYDLFARSVVEYGDGGRSVRICDPASYRLPKGARWQRLEHIDSTPASRGLAEAIPGLFQLDTGSAGSIDFTKDFHERNGMLRSRNTRRMNSLGSGGSFSVEVGRLKEFRLGGQLYRDLVVAFRTGGISREGSAGTVGREVLNRFTMVFDYPHQRLAFLAAGRSGACG